MACARQTDRQTDKRQLTPHYTWLHGKMCDLRDNDMRSGEEDLSLEIMRLISPVPFLTCKPGGGGVAPSSGAL